VVDSNEWYVFRLAVAWRIRKALPGWKEPCRKNCGRRAGEVSVLDPMGTEYPAVEEEHGVTKTSQYLSVVTSP